jgi:hypothetical protein
VTANGYEPVSLLTNLIRRRLAKIGVKDNPQSPKQPETFEVLSELTLTTVEELAAASIHHFALSPVLASQCKSNLPLSDGQPFPLLDFSAKTKSLRRDRQAQFCPACLREASYHRLSWVPWEITVCLKHQCLLADKCSCGRAGLSIHEIVQHRCSWCGADLAHIVIDNISYDTLALFAQRTIRLWWGITAPAETHTGWTLPAEPITVLHRFFELLTDAIKVIWKWEYWYESVGTSLDVHVVQTAAFSALTNWPQGFWNFLQAYLQRERALHEYNRFVHSNRKSPLAAHLWDIGQWPNFTFVGIALRLFLINNGFRIDSTNGTLRIYWPDS